GPDARSESPDPGVSILMTRAPMSASCIVAYGPAMKTPTSSTVTPASGPAVRSPPATVAEAAPGPPAPVASCCVEFCPAESCCVELCVTVHLCVSHVTVDCLQ